MALLTDFTKWQVSGAFQNPTTTAVIPSVMDGGTATSGSTTTITDTNMNLDVNVYMGSNVLIERLGSPVRTAFILSNTIDTLTMSVGPAVAAGDTYRVLSMGRGTFSVRTANNAIIRTSANVVRAFNGDFVTVS